MFLAIPHNTTLMYYTTTKSYLKRDSIHRDRVPLLFTEWEAHAQPPSHHGWIILDPLFDIKLTQINGLEWILS